MSSFVLPWFAIAGAVAAAVPVIVHLLNKRRFRVIEWAAMDFLREALNRSRRMMELRDLLLLLVRVLCLLALGFALELAGSYWSRMFLASADPNQPVHAVVIVDNSLSMAYQNGDGILLDVAKDRAKEAIDDLPAGSVITVIATCNPRSAISNQAHARREDAFEALAAIKPVDRAARPGLVIEQALNACRHTTSMAARRIFFITDQQVSNWSAKDEAENLKRLPCPMEVVQVQPDEVENVSVAEVQLRDGVANAQCPGTFIAKIRYEGRRSRSAVPVLLSVDGKVQATQKIDLQPGQDREVVFPDYRFAAPARPGEASYATAEVSIPAEHVPFDRLPDDNRRAVVVPVTESLPVVFVDALGEREDPQRKIRGDTWWLRRWLAPTARPGKDQPLVQSRHVSMDQLSAKVLADARLVVVAGVVAPQSIKVALLRDYVEQGGNLLIAAGGGFDPAAWNRAAWADGEGILPAPLAPRPVGRLRDEWSAQAAATAPLTLKVADLAHYYFRPEGVSEDELRGMLGLPTVFLKVIVAQCNDSSQDQAAKAAARRFGKQRDELARIDRQLAAIQSAAQGSQQAIRDLQSERETIQPSWLAWKRSAGQGDELPPVDELAAQARAVVLARYNNDSPMLIQRQWGRGKVLLLTTSLTPEWTTLHDQPQSAWLMDRIARSLLAETLPSRNVDSNQGIVLPVAMADRATRFALIDPDGNRKALTVDALGGDRYGIGLAELTRRGIYRVQWAGGRGAATLREIPLAVNAPPQESQLVPAQRSDGQPTFADATARAFSLGRVQLAGIDLWKWLVALILALMVAEFLLAARSASRTEAAA